MKPACCLLAAATVLGVVVLPAMADDPPASPSSTPAKAPAPLPKAPEFSGYAWVSRFEAEVVKADENKVTFRIYWEHAVANNNRNGNRGRPSLHGTGRNHHSPFATRRPNVQIKWEHHDYEVPYVAESLVRTKALPPKVGPDGKRGYYSASEQDALSQPLGAPGFQAAKADLVPGTIIEAHIIRDKTIPANKVTDADMRLKYAVILRHDPNPPKDIANPSSAAPKKK